MPKYQVTIKFTTDKPIPSQAGVILVQDMQAQIESLFDGTYSDLTGPIDVSNVEDATLLELDGALKYVSPRDWGSVFKECSEMEDTFSKSEIIKEFCLKKGIPHIELKLATKCSACGEYGCTDSHLELNDDDEQEGRC